jgi:hypothetical protein
MRCSMNSVSELSRMRFVHDLCGGMRMVSVQTNGKRSVSQYIIEDGVSWVSIYVKCIARRRLMQRDGRMMMVCSFHW